MKNFFRQGFLARHKKWSFPSRISSVNLTKSTVNCWFCHICWRNPYWRTSIFVQCRIKYWKFFRGKFLRAKAVKCARQLHNIQGNFHLKDNLHNLIFPFHRLGYPVCKKGTLSLSWDSSYYCVQNPGWFSIMISIIP